MTSEGIYIIIGSILLVVGAILLVTRLTRKPSLPVSRDDERKISADPGSPARLIRSGVNEIACPNCGSRMDSSLAFCPSCGHSTAEEKPPADNVCPYCESILPPGVFFCPACGRRLEGGHPAPARAPAPAPTPKPAPAPARSPVSSGGWSAPTDSDL